MSLLVPLNAGAGRNAREAFQRRRLRRRALAAVGTGLLVVGMAAVPAPVWATTESLSERATQLRTWIEEAHREQRAVATFRSSGGEDTAEQVDARLSTWLAPHDPVETRNLLLKLARAGGLDVTDIAIVRDVQPTSSDGPAHRGTTVLGASIGPPPAPVSHGAIQPLPLAADRYLVSGTGALPAVLAFCGVVGAMPHPLRLRSVRVDAAGDGHRFKLGFEKLLDATRENRAPPEIDDA